MTAAAAFLKLFNSFKLKILVEQSLLPDAKKVLQGLKQTIFILWR